MEVEIQSWPLSVTLLVIFPLCWLARIYEQQQIQYCLSLTISAVVHEHCELVVNLSSLDVNLSTSKTLQLSK